MVTDSTSVPGKSLPARASRALAAVLLLAGNTGVALLLLGAALLRETPEFWRNEGGYPEFLREAVRWGFPCGLPLDGILVAGALGVVIRHRRAWPGILRGGFILALAQGFLLTAAVGVAVSNNLENLREGRPWHWKPDP